MEKRGKVLNSINAGLDNRFALLSNINHQLKSLLVELIPLFPSSGHKVIRYCFTISRIFEDTR